MVPGSLLTSNAPLRRRASAPRRSAKLQFAFAQIGMALERRRGGCDTTAQGADGDEHSAVDALLGRLGQASAA